MAAEVSIAYCELNKALLQQISCCQKNIGARSLSFILGFIKEYSEANLFFILLELSHPSSFKYVF